MMFLRDAWSFITNPKMLVRKIKGHPFWYLEETEIESLESQGYVHSGCCVYIYAHGKYSMTVAHVGWRNHIEEYIRSGKKYPPNYLNLFQISDVTTSH